MDKKATRNFKNFAIIVPVGNNETEHIFLKKQLEKLCFGAEIIFSKAQIRTEALNIPAVKTSKRNLWFLHSDSKISKDNIDAIPEKIENKLYYFKLKYDGHFLMKLNSFGANFRSKYLKSPFGDQGFIIKKDVFIKLGKYQKDLAYGEDHMLVRKSLKNNIKLEELNSYLISSSRKYQKNGWLKTTFLHNILWLWQYFKSFNR